ncbi:putative methyltransferase-domain-containing protein [Dissophora ornata]|nr:putative methyltransferase-domain-containing protein [Dissophora ornata]
MYYYIRLLKNTPVEAVIQEPFKLVFTITTDLTEKFYDKPCKLRCQTVVRTPSTIPGATAADTIMTIMSQGLSQGYSLDYDPKIGYCSVDIRMAPCMTPYDECQIVLSLDPAPYTANYPGAKTLVEPPEYEILPAWSLPIQLKPAPLNFSKKTKHRKVNKKYLTDTRQDLVERYFRLPPHLTGAHGRGRSLLVREDAREGFMARHIWDSGVFMTKYLMLADSWLSKYMEESRQKGTEQRTVASEEKPLESSLAALSVSNSSTLEQSSISSGIEATVTEATPASTASCSSSTRSQSRKRVCLELGAGTGLVGIAVAVAFPELSVLSTDLDEALALMQQNVDANQALLPNNNMEVGFLDWAEKGRKVEPVEILLLADVVYNDLSHECLLQTILDYSDDRTKVLLGYKFRHEAEQQFFERAKEYFDITNVHQQDTMQLFVLTRKSS